MGQDSGLDQVVNAVVQTATLGAVQYGDGKLNADIKKNLAFRALDEGLGEVTGRNVARKANFDQQDAVREEKAAKKQEISDEQYRKQRNDLRASRQAGAIRATAQAKKNTSLGTPNLTQDFLGL